jgi:transposase
MIAGGMGFCLAVERAATREVFEVYDEEVLGESLRPGQVVMMDDLCSHKGDRVRQLNEERSCELLYLPSYSPDYNPLEDAFVMLKATPAASSDIVAVAHRPSRYDRRSRDSKSTLQRPLSGFSDRLESASSEVRAWCRFSEDWGKHKACPNLCSSSPDLLQFP